MSMSYYAYLGYGVSDNFVRYVTNDGINKLIELAEERTQKEYKETVGNYKTPMECLSDMEFTSDGATTGLLALMCEVISKQENVRLTDAWGEDEEALILEPYYPWYGYNNTEKQLDEHTLEELIHKYLRIAGVPEDKLEHCDYFTITGCC